MPVIRLADIRADRQRRCALRGHDFDDRHVCRRCGLTVT